MPKRKMVKKKTPIPHQPAEKRIENFEEVALGYTEEQALFEADRCLQCKNRACVKGCPVEVPIPEFIKKITEKDYRGALKLIKEVNVLPAICGRVCPQETQCEAFCTMGKIKGSDPVGIGRLERFVADWDLKNPEELPEGAVCEDIEDPIKVAVIGAGPAGLTCAGELVQKGYDVTVFEAFHKAGGVLVYGIPEFRLPKDIVQAEVTKLMQCGVKVELNKLMGKTLTYEDLQARGFKAFFIGVGAGLPIFIPIPGIEYSGVLSANEYLTRVNLMKAYRDDYDTPVDRGNRVAVIGGGNVAMDSARTALRMGAEKVMVIYRRSEKELPARREEYEHAVEEGIEFHFLRNPTKIQGDEKEFVKGIEVIKMELGEPDESGRRRPIKQPGTEYIIDVDMVIMAIGTRANPIFTKSTSGLKLNKWGYIETNEHLQSSISNVFAGGDIVTGAATVISAMGQGREAAKAMHKYIQGELE
jgi:glutamate synthase (NADPH) small chain